MSRTLFSSRLLHVAIAAALGAHAGNAAAIDFDLFGTEIKFDNLVTIGASWRTQDRDPTNIGKSSLYKLENPGSNDPDTGSGLCLRRTSQTAESGPSFDQDENQYAAGVIPAGCSTSNSAAISDYTSSARPGSFNPNSDQGNLNFDKYDIVHAIAKLTSDISFSVADYNFFIRPIYYFDANYTGFEQNWVDTTLQPATAALPDSAEELVGTNLHLLDYHVSHVFSIPGVERELAVKVGSQALNWGESSLLIFNSLNLINPPDASKLRFPGLDLKEVLQPVGMVTLGTDVMENVGIEVFYQYEWTPLIIDPPGTFFSASDTLGAGGSYSMLSQGRAPDDPNGLYRGIDTCNFDDPPALPGAPGCVDSTGLLGSTSARVIHRDPAEEKLRTPEEFDLSSGQFGGKVSLFLEDFNNGTEVGLYFANYHSRYPVVSMMAAQETCLDSTIGAASLITNCGFNGPGVPADEEPVPVDTVRIVVEYPENIQVYGVSFNTTIGDYALSGEYAFRPNLPIQIHTTDLFFAAAQPAFPRQDITVAPGVVIPGRRSAVPDFLTAYRGGTPGVVTPGSYIRGWEEMKQGNLGLTLLRLIGGDNPIGASQMTILLETGLVHVLDFPELDELQFNGGGADTHISSGADGTVGINPRDLRTDPNDPTTNRSAPTNRQNVTAQADQASFGDEFSGGYRMINLNRWDDALFGATLQSLFIVRHDVFGQSPGIAQNFTYGRKEFNLGLQFEYLSAWFGEVRYTWFTGGKNRDVLRDRDNVFVTMGYQF